MRKLEVVFMVVLALIILISVPASAVQVTHTPPGLTPEYRAKVFIIERILGTGGYGNRYLRIQTADEGKVFGIEVDDPGTLQQGDRVRITNDNRLVLATSKKAAKKPKKSGDSYAEAPPPAPVQAAANCCLGGAYLWKFKGETLNMIISHEGCGRRFTADTTSNAPPHLEFKWQGTAIPRTNSNCCQVSFSRKGPADSEVATGVFCPRGNAMYGSGTSVRSFPGGETPIREKWTAKAQ